MVIEDALDRIAARATRRVGPDIDRAGVIQFAVSGDSVSEGWFIAPRGGRYMVGRGNHPSPETIVGADEVTLARLALIDEIDLASERRRVSVQGHQKYWWQLLSAHDVPLTFGQMYAAAE